VRTIAIFPNPIAPYNVRVFAHSNSQNRYDNRRAKGCAVVIASLSRAPSPLRSQALQLSAPRAPAGSRVPAGSSGPQAQQQLYQLKNVALGLGLGWLRLVRLMV
jgi:hypothetical protein